MTFLSPAILWGLLAATIPIIIHLFSLTKTKDMEFSSIRFLEEMKHESIRNLQLKQWLLVLLRTLIIASLVLMLARPTTEGFVSSWLQGDVDSKAVIIIDNSASMGLEHENGTLLENAKFHSKSLIRKLDEDTHIELYQTNPFQLIFSGAQDRSQRISQSINAVEQSLVYDDLWKVLQLSLNNTEQDKINKECFVFSDFQSLPDTSTINDLQKNKLSDWKLYFIGQETLNDNIGIYEVLPVSQVKLPDHLMKLNTVVSNEGKIEKRNVPIELFLNDERVGQVVTAFDPQRSKEFLFQAYPGKSGVIRGALSIPEDDFPYDNVQTFELSIPKKIKCTLIGRSVEDVYLLEKALRSISGEKEYISVERKIMNSIDNLFLETTDVLLLHRPKDISKQALDDIQRFSEKGGGLIWISGILDVPLDPTITSSLKLPSFTQSINTSEGSFFQTSITDIQHPLFADLSVRKMASELPEVFQYNRVRPRSNQQTIIRTNTGDPYLLDYNYIGGRIFYFASPVGLDWNDLAIRGLFVPLLHRMIILLATDEANTMPVFSGSDKVINIPKYLLNGTWEVYTPSLKKPLESPDYQNEQLVIEHTDEIGSYEVYKNGELFTAFSTHLNPKERPNKRADGYTIVDLIGDERSKYISNSLNISNEIHDIRYGKSLWRNFLILAIVLMLLESIIVRPEIRSMNPSE